MRNINIAKELTFNDIYLYDTDFQYKGIKTIQLNVFFRTMIVIIYDYCQKKNRLTDTRSV